MKYLFKIAALMMVIVISSLGTTVAYAKNNTGDLLIQDNDLLKFSKSEYNYIKGQFGDTDTIYTYKSDNKTFKVVETASENFDSVDSIIYINNSKGEFIEYATQRVRVINNEIVITINENGRINTDKIKLNNKNEISNAKELPNQSNNIFEAPEVYTTGSPTWDGFPVSSWIYWGETTGQTDVYRYTSAAIIATLTSLVASLFGISGRAVVAGISAVAAMIVKDAIERIWWTANTYYQTVIPPEEWMFRTKVAEYSHIYVFKSSNKTGANLTGDYYKYYYDSLYVE